MPDTEARWHVEIIDLAENKIHRSEAPGTADEIDAYLGTIGAPSIATDLPDLGRVVIRCGPPLDNDGTPRYQITASCAATEMRWSLERKPVIRPRAEVA